MAIFNFLCEFLFILYYFIKSDEELYLYTFSCAVPFDSIIQFIVSYFILKIHFYKHHYFSIILNIIIFFLIFIIDLINIICFHSFDGYMLLLFINYKRNNQIFFVLIFSLIVLSVDKNILKRLDFFSMIQEKLLKL